jgi:hypothetical protein
MALWRGGLSERRIAPFGCVAVVKSASAVIRENAVAGFSTAAQRNGGKPPRHRGMSQALEATGTELVCQINTRLTRFSSVSRISSR